MSKPDNLFVGFDFYVLKKILIVRNHGTGKHEILPYQESMFITSIIKAIRRVHPASQTRIIFMLAANALIHNSLPSFAVVSFVKIWRDHVRPLWLGCLDH